MLRTALAGVLALAATPLFAQTETTLDTRIAIDAGGQATYRLVEVYQSRGRFIPWDIGYIDFGGSVYHELYVGLGGVPIAGKRVTLIEECYVVQSVGPAARRARYIQPYSLLIVDFGRHVSGLANYLLYLPVNEAGAVQHLIDKIKLEYDFGQWKLGAGYGAYKFSRDGWQNKPFVTGTVKLGRAGSLEIWIQKTPSGHQIRANYLVSRKR